jgi:hypothetical protein
MIVDNIAIDEGSDCLVVLAGRVTSPLLEKPFRLWFSFDARFRGYVTPTADPFLIALLPICSSRREDLHVAGSVTKELLEVVPRVLDVFHGMSDQFLQVRVSSDSVASPHLNLPEKRQVAAFLSLGIDSLYTLKKHSDSIGLAITVVLNYVEAEYAYQEMLTDAIASTLEKVNCQAQSVLVRSNIQELSDRFLDWTQFYHGACLASIANIFARGIERTLIAASWPPWNQHLCGSNPELDPLWSTPLMEIAHDSPIDKFDKVKDLCESPELLEHLRVCLHPLRSRFNCGWCCKCVRATLLLHLFNRLAYCPTLPQEFDPQRISLVAHYPGSGRWGDLDRVLERLTDSPLDRNIRDALLRDEKTWEDRLPGSLSETTEKLWKMLKADRLSEARELLKEGYELHPYDPMVNYYGSFVAGWVDGDFQKAITLLEAAREYGCEPFVVESRLGTAHLLAGQIRQGVLFLSVAFRDRPVDLILRALKDVTWAILRSTRLLPPALRLYRRVRRGDSASSETSES